MDSKIRDALFFTIIVSLIFNNIPKVIHMGIVGGVVGSKLVFYPLIVGIVYTVYCQYIYGNVFTKFIILKKYLLVYITLVMISLGFGLYNYPYFESIINGPIERIDRLHEILTLISDYGVDLSREFAVCCYMVIRVLKNLFSETFYTFGGAYMVYCWYKSDWREAINVLCKALLWSLLVVWTYSLFEIFYLCGNESARNILECITPYIHTVKNDGSWWPPLLWPNQLRSVFAEPSYFGIYCAFAFPFIWLMILKTKLNEKRAYIYVCVACVMSFFLVLTKARTGFMLHIGELVVLFLLLMCTRNKLLLRKGTIILLCSMFSFVFGNLFIANCMTVNKNVNTQLTTVISNYVDSNAKSLINPDARSNRARYSVMEADIKVGLEHPLLGVGSGLRNAYVIDAFSERALENKEIQMWLEFSKRLGILKSGIPKLGEYTSRFAETGMLGLLVFLLPAIYLVIILLRKLKGVSENEQVIYIMFLTSFAGMLASGIGDTINITFCYWVLLGLGYAMCFGKSDEKLDNEST